MQVLFKTGPLQRARGKASKILQGAQEGNDDPSTQKDLRTSGVQNLSEF
jgi:hypothetical protein